MIAKESQFKVIEEFFQLFKTPWEFYEDEREYDVLIISKDTQIEKINAKFFLIFGNEGMEFDIRKKISLDINPNIKVLRFAEFDLPIYTKISTFKNISDCAVCLKSESGIIGLKIKEENKTFFRIGYNLFEEVGFLLSKGQPIECAFIPTLEVHIALLRKWIVNAGIPLIEVPPIPAGYDFIACLSHDVDFVKICNHIFGHAMWGFIYRGLVGSCKKLINGKTSYSRLLQKWKAVLLLPFVYLGLADDFWFQFDRYLKIEKYLKSTYFFIPFKNRVGNKVSNRNASLRAAKYDINDLKKLLSYLIKEGYEIGVHGIDAWHNVESGYQERKRISEIIGESNLGIRMHWLLHDDQTFQILEKAGYLWDSSFGYNETVGYRGGTTQVFRPIEVKNLLELPIHIQDTTLFYPRRMGLSEKQAMNLCKKLINNASICGGVLTINWHQRSLGPERLWEDFYVKLLEELRANRPWFASINQAVGWFRKRRSVSFDEVQFIGDKLRLCLRSSEADIQPPLLIRVHRPQIQNFKNNNNHLKNYFDLTWSGERKIEIPI